MSMLDVLAHYLKSLLHAVCVSCVPNLDVRRRAHAQTKFGHHLVGYPVFSVLQMIALAAPICVCKIHEFQYLTERRFKIFMFLRDRIPPVNVSPE